METQSRPSRDYEVRYVTGIEVRKDEQSGTVEGIASKVGVEYDMGWYMERIKPGAFDDVLGDDVRVLFNHDPNQILGRTKSGTAEIFKTPEGHLGYRYKTPDRSYARDLEDAINAGDVDQSSFAFMIRDQSWIEETRDGKTVNVREISKMERLYDVSPVTYPASPDTTVAKRSFDAIQEERQEQEETTNEAAKRSARLRELNLQIKKDLI